MAYSLKALLLLNGIQRLNGRTIRDFSRRGMKPEDFLQSGETLWREEGLSDKAIAFLHEGIRTSWHQKELEKLETLQGRFITFEDPDYPVGLWDLPDPPVGLYCRGNFSSSRRCVGIVGTRRCSRYAWDVAASLGRSLGNAGWGVVSGGALGIDGAAHGGALDQGGYTLAVFGTGIDRFFPGDHRDLFHSILEDGGAFLSEYPLGTPGKAWHFPARNRIITGLSEKIIVVEAPQKSGAMITAKIAGELGREVWSVPGRIDEKICSGSNLLLREGAFPLVSVRDFTELLEPLGEQQELFPREQADLKPGFSECEEKIVSFLRFQGEQTVDKIAQEVTMSAAFVTGKLALLEAKGRVKVTGPGRWGACS